MQLVPYFLELKWKSYEFLKLNEIKEIKWKLEKSEKRRGVGWDFINWPGTSNGPEVRAHHESKSMQPHTELK
jgi:hypothetical protein